MQEADKRETNAQTLTSAELLFAPLEEGPQAAHSHLRFLFGC